MHRHAQSGGINEVGLASLLAITGFGLLYLVDSKVFAAELVIFITFAVNVTLILLDATAERKSKARKMTLALAVGALLAALAA